MRRFLAILTTFMIASWSGNLMAQLQWREFNKEIPAKALNDPRRTDGVEIYGSNGSIFIRTQHRVQVRVFTILGQSVSSVTLNPGTSELRIGTRGIYIVKIGNITQKVAL